jgi:hypothetical protein
MSITLRIMNSNASNATTPNMINEPVEFIKTLTETPGTRLTRCAGWTVHEIAAHMAAGTAEQIRLFDAHLAGRPDPNTRPFEEREAPFRALQHGALLEKLVELAAQRSSLRDRLNGTQVAFTGWTMSIDQFATHTRSECSLHRWDIVGRDDIGWTMLAQPDLASHALAVFANMRNLSETPSNRLATLPNSEPVEMILRSHGLDDLIIRVDDQSAVTIELRVPDARQADVELEPAQRLLALWRRREPSSPIEIHTDGPRRRLLTTLFGW